MFSDIDGDFVVFVFHLDITHYSRTIPFTSVKDNNDYLGLNITASITSLQVVGQ